MLRIKINDSLKESLKNKDEISVSTIRLIMAAMKDRDIAERSTGNMEGIDDPTLLSMMQAMIKQRQESSKMYADAGRDDLADREMDEIKVIEQFLPAQLTEDEVKAVIQSIIADTHAESVRDMGKVMAVLKDKYAGQMDMGKASGLVKQKLA